MTIDEDKVVRASHKQVRMLFSSVRSPDGTDNTDSPPRSTNPNLWAVNIDGSDLVPLTTIGSTGSYMPQWSPDGTQILFISDRRVDGLDDATSVDNLWRVKADGTGLMPLTRGADGAVSFAAGLSQPQWSPDGTQITFESTFNVDGTNSENPNRTSNIWRMKADGTALMPLTTDVADSIRNRLPRWSPEGAHIAFFSNRNSDGTSRWPFASNVWAIGAGGPAPIPLSPALPSIAPFDPGVIEYEWSPDGTQVVFVSRHNVLANFNLFRAKADGTGLVALTNATVPFADSEGPRWSPDGTQIAFASSLNLDDSDPARDTGNASSNIWRVKPDSTGLTPLTGAIAMNADSGNPCWSPDGSEIVFESRRNVDGIDAPNAVVNIWKMKADGSGIVALTRSTAPGADSSNPQWSPDGTQIVFDSRKNIDGTDTANPNLTSNVWRVKADGSGLVPLGTSSALDADSFNAIWSPGGTRVIFLSRSNIDGSNSINANGAANIWRAKADGSGRAPVTRLSGPFNCGFPECFTLQLRP